MRPWLCDILACPIDKFFPLDLIIFSFDTGENVFKEILEAYEKRDIISIKKEEIIEMEQKNEELLLKDEIVIQKSTLEIYINAIISSVKEVDTILDKSSFKLSKLCIHIIQNDIKQKIHSKTDELYEFVYGKQARIDAGMFFTNPELSDKTIKKMLEVIERPDVIIDPYAGAGSLIDIFTDER